MKIFVLILLVIILYGITTTQTVFAEPTITVSTDKSSYQYGDRLIIIFEVSELIDKKITFQISDELGKKSSVTNVEIDKLKTQLTAPYPFTANIFKPGIYYIDATYGGANSTTSFSIIDSDKIVVPQLVKEIIVPWSSGIMTDNEFARQIRTLVEENIIPVPGLEMQNKESAVKIPQWVKNTVKWWSEDLISDSDFALGIQYLLRTRIMVV